MSPRFFGKAFAAFFLLAVAGCATTNDAGVRLYKKPDLSKVVAGTPVKKVAGLKNPVKREIISKGDLKGAELWLYEWDAPNDEVNNRMFTSVVVKDGALVGFVEETVEKWQKDPKLHNAAVIDSKFENLASLQARIASYQAAAAVLANYNASRPQFTPVAPTQNFYSYQPQNSSNFQMFNPGASRQTTRPDSWQVIGNTAYGSDGSSVQRIGNQFYGSDGSSAQVIGNQIYGSDGSSAQVIGNQIYRSDGSSSQRIGNQIYHSDGGSTQIIGNTLYNSGN